MRFGSEAVGAQGAPSGAPWAFLRYLNDRTLAFSDLGKSKKTASDLLSLLVIGRPTRTIWWRPSHP